MNMPRGFTLIETMVAVSIVAISIVGPLYSLQKGVVASYAARDRLVASSLAQEGIEYAHSIRDANYLFNIANGGAPRSWFYGLDGTGGSVNCTGGASCIVDMTQGTVSVCSGTCPVLKLSSTGLYNQSVVSGSNVATRFTRAVKLTSLNAHEMKITVTVSWTTNAVPYSVSISETMQDWL
ncbi:MAG: prepilin-type N-terminal cleavage/methylation domain-containing protein [Candidatus Pacebacteria bacterium]|nr:prepilin-type N-terminal cleavage/methylation domain-containing protein [Candidatus Paceibacterota bacterium]